MSDIDPISRESVGLNIEFSLVTQTYPREPQAIPPEAVVTMQVRDPDGTERELPAEVVNGPLGIVWHTTTAQSFLTAGIHYVRIRMQDGERDLKSETKALQVNDFSF